MKATKCRKGGKFNLFMGILVGVLAGLACGLRWLISEAGDTWLRAVTKQLMGQEKQLVAPEAVTQIKEYLKDEYILIALIAAAAFIVLAILFFIADGANKKKALKRAYCDEYAEEEQMVDEYYEEETPVEAAPVQANTCCKLQGIKEKVAEKFADEKVKKVAAVAAACAVTAVVVSQLGGAVKAKRRHQFYRWLG